MRIQLASDLHLELLRRWPQECLVTPAGDADVLVLAGDIHRGLDANYHQPGDTLLEPVLVREVTDIAQAVAERLLQPAN